MRAMNVMILMAVVCWLHCGPLHAQASQARSSVVSVGLFKNGLAVVRRSFTAEGPGVYEIADVPEPVHGTFWIESNAMVDTRVTTRDVEVELDFNDATDFQRDLAGQKVTIRFREPTMPSVSGTIVRLADEKARAWGREYVAPQYGYRYSGWGSNAMSTGTPPRHLILDTDGGRMYIDASMVATLSTEAKGSVKRRRPVLEFTVQKGKEAQQTPIVIDISYLAKGMSWAPSYRVDITDSKSLRLAQQAVIRNELGDFENAEFFLISGYPSIEFAHVNSPLSPRTTLTSFFSQLAQQGALRHGSRSDVISQNAVSYNDPPPGAAIDLAAQPDGTGVDLHYESIGKRTLDEGDSLMVNVASGQAAYDRIIDWTIPDDRDEHGRPIEQYQRQQEPEKYDDSPYDAVRFRNPLQMPMTTAPAIIVGGNRFYGQRTSYWTNVGEECTLGITKALSIRTRHVEHEEQSERASKVVGRTSYWNVPVKGEITVNNHRNETVNMVIRRRFSGQLVEADESPKAILLEDGVYSLNQRNELVWSIELKPGEERSLTYRYEVLVWH